MNTVDSLRLISFLGIFIGMVAWQYWQPAYPSKDLLRRWRTNLSLALINGVIPKILIPGGLVNLAWWCETRSLGFFNVYRIPNAVEIIVSLFILDGIIYAQHVLFHRLPWLWQLHALHHRDRELDVSTALRFHPLEIVISLGIKATAIITLGLSGISVILFEIILNGMAMFNHSNIQFTDRINRYLAAIIVTPNMHRVHHSQNLSESNRNYGFNLSLWDRLFKTYTAKSTDELQHLRIGVEAGTP